MVMTKRVRLLSTIILYKLPRNMDILYILIALWCVWSFFLFLFVCFWGGALNQCFWKMLIPRPEILLHFVKCNETITSHYYQSCYLLSSSRSYCLSVGHLNQMNLIQSSMTEKSVVLWSLSSKTTTNSQTIIVHILNKEPNIYSCMLFYLLIYLLTYVCYVHLLN